MKRNKLLLLLSILAVIGFASPSMAATTLKKMGTHPFYTPPLTSISDLQTMVQKRGSRIEEGFVKAGAADLYPAFVEQFPNAQIEQVQVQPGESMEWMLFRRWGKGPVAAAKDIVWGGRAPFEAFKFSIQKDGNLYNFIVPLVCGNVALQNVTAAPVAVEVPPPAPEPVPIAPPPVPEAIGGPVAILGYMWQSDPAHYIFGKLGYSFAVTEQFHITPSIGFYGHVAGEDGESSVAVDLLASYYVVPNFALGIGVGYWSGELQTRDDWGRDHDFGDDNNCDVILAAWYDLPFNWSGVKPAIYVEARNDVENFDDVRQTGRIGGGVMIHF